MQGWELQAVLGGWADLITNYLPARTTHWPHAKAAPQLLFGGLGTHPKRPKLELD